jgi:EmrB/QacA subfamily drug resistance transporter
VRITQKQAVGVVYVSAMFMTIMDATIVNVALPTIGRDFGVRPTAVNSIAIAYLVSLAVFIPAAGWLGDRFGAKRVLLLAIAIFTGASMLCGLATSLPMLVAFRVLQGAAGGMLTPIGLAMLWRVFPPSERLGAAALLAIPTTLAPATGPVLGGLLVTELSWRWVFFVNLPIGAAAFLFGLVFLKEQDHAPPMGRFDVAGFLLSGLGLGLLMYGVSEGPNVGWGDVAVLATIIAGVILIATMVVVELRVPHPLVALRLLGNRLFRDTNAVQTVSFMAFIGTIFAISLYYQDGRGLDPLMAGLSIFPEAVGVMVGAQFASRALYPALGPRRHIILGLIGSAAAMAALALMGATTSLWWARLIMFLLGFAMGQVFVPTQAASFATISHGSTSSASTLFNALRQFSGAVGVALLTTVIVLIGPTHVVSGHQTTDLTAYRAAFLVAAAVGLLGVIPALAIRDLEAAETIPAGRYRRRHLATSAAEQVA